MATYTQNMELMGEPVVLQDYTLYGAGRLGTYNVASGKALYELTDHLGNTREVVTKNTGTGLAETVSYTDYYPHGGVLPGRNYVNSFGGVPYQYQGMEKDPETNLLNFELRQYDARLGRWYNPDPMGEFHSPYLAMGNNPVSVTDPTGGYTSDQFWNSSDAPNIGAYNNFDFKDPYTADGAQINEVPVAHPNENPYFAMTPAERRTEWAAKGNTIENRARSISDRKEGLNKYFGTLGIFHSQGDYYQIYNYALISNYGTMAGSAGLADVTDLVHALKAINRAKIMEDFYAGSATSAWNHGNYSEWFEYKMKGVLGEDADAKFSKAAQPYAQMIADLNPLMNAGHIISGASTGKNGYGEEMGATDYAFAGIGMLGLGELKGGTTAVKGGSRVFWSGGDEAMNAAMNFAKANGGTTLEMTRAGQNLQKLIQTRNIPWSEAKPMWQRLSTKFAQGAEGSVHFFPGANINPGSIWLNFEKPTLINNGVKIINH